MQFKDHSYLCKESDVINSKLKNELNSLKNNELIGIDQTLRKTKNMISLLKTKIEKNFPNESSINLVEESGPIVTRSSKFLSSCPVFHKPNHNLGKFLILKENEEQEDKIISRHLEIQENLTFNNKKKRINDTVNKFELFKKKREINKLMKTKELIESYKNYVKILFKLQQDIKNFRS